MDWGLILPLGVIVFFAMGLEGITGFGGTVLALPFLTMLLPVKTAVWVIPMMSVIWGLVVIAQSWRLIDRRVLLTILLFSAVGIPLGILGLDLLPEYALKLVLGLFVIFAAIKGLYNMRRPPSESDARQSGLQKALTGLVLLLGGVFQGAFACGGPLFVIYVSREVKDKSAFRVTLSCIWVVCNIAIFVRNLLVGGVYPEHFWSMWGCIVPFFLAGALIGNVLHKRADIKTFTLLTNIILLLAGTSSLAGAIGGIA